MSVSFTATEALLAAAAREIEDGSVVLCGTGLPLVATALAKQFHAPNAVLVTEAGLVDYSPYVPLYSIADTTASRGCSYSCDLYEVFSTILYRGFADVAVLGVAEIDRFGNLNTTVVGEYNNPSVRMGGAGGAPEFLSFARKVIFTSRAGRFVEKLDYLTSPGYLTCRRERDESRHFPIGSGPKVLVSRKGLFNFDDETGEIYLGALMPGYSLESVMEDVPWKLRVSPELDVVAPPTDGEVEFIRTFDITVSLPRRVRSLYANCSVPEDMVVAGDGRERPESGDSRLPAAGDAQTPPQMQSPERPVRSRDWEVSA